MVELSEEDLQQIIGGYQQEPKDTTKIKLKPIKLPPAVPTTNPTPMPKP